MKKQIEKLISDWQIEIANCEQIINSCSVSQSTKDFTEGEKNAISECLQGLKKLNEATESEDKVCNTCKHNTPNNALCYECVHASPGFDNYANVDER